MPVPKGTIFRVRTYSSGKRVRIGIYNGKIVETKSLPSRKPTKTRKHLNKSRRRIGR